MFLSVRAFWFCIGFFGGKLVINRSFFTKFPLPNLFRIIRAQRFVIKKSKCLLNTYLKPNTYLYVLNQILLTKEFKSTSLYTKYTSVLCWYVFWGRCIVYNDLNISYCVKMAYSNSIATFKFNGHEQHFLHIITTWETFFITPLFPYYLSRKDELFQKIFVSIWLTLEKNH